MFRILLVLAFVIVLALIVILAGRLRLSMMRVVSGGTDDVLAKVTQPVNYYRDNIYVIGHVAGVSGAGKTYLGEKCRAEFTELVVQDLDEFADEVLHDSAKSIDEKLASRWKHIEARVKQFTIAHVGKPILFVGYNSEGVVYNSEGVVGGATPNHWLRMLGVKLFLDPPIRQVISQRVARETSLSQTPSGADVVKWLNNNDADYRLYSDAGYDFVNMDLCMQTIRLAYRNMMYRINNPQLFANRNIVWVNGPSASGKSTLLKRLSTLPNIRVCDLDAISDKSALEHEDDEQRVSANFEAVQRELSADPSRGVVFVGLPIYLYGIASHLFAIDTDPELNYVRGQLRELNTVCENIDLIKDQLHVGDDLDHRIDKLRTQIEHRTPVVLDPRDVIANIRRLRANLIASGFKFMPADAIVDRVQELMI